MKRALAVALLVTAAAVLGLPAAGAAAVGPSQPVEPIEPVVWRGLASPESIAHDELTDTYLVSNINGPVAAKDNNGFIARLRPSGGTATKWIEGGRDGVTLHAPKGLALTRNTVWVTDIDTVRGFDRHTGRPKAEIPVPGASFLNDIAVGPTGVLYLTDSGVGPDSTGALVPTGTDSVIRVDRAGRVHRIASGTHLNQPNGLFRYAHGRMLVGTRATNEVLTLDRDGRVLQRRTVPGAVVDGVDVLPGKRTVVSTHQEPGLWRLNRDGTASPFLPRLPLPVGAADFSVDTTRSLLLLPLLLNNEVWAARLPGRA